MLRFLTVLLFGVLCLAADGLAQDTLIIDHKNQTATHRKNKYEDGDRIRVRGPLTIKVDSTNSAVYSCSVDTEDAKVPEVEAGTAFLSGISSYVPELALRLTGWGAMSSADPDPTNDVVQALAKVDAAMVGQTGLRSAFAKTIAALDSWRDTIPVPASWVNTFRSEIRRFCPVADSSCKRLSATKDLSVALSDLAAATALLQRKIAAGLINQDTTPQRRLFEAATGALAKADEMMAFAYGTEKVVYKTYNAKASMGCSDDVPVKFSKGYTTTVKVAPTSIPGLQRTATTAPYEATFDIQPDWLFRPALGLAFFYVHDAEYPGYGVDERPDGDFDIRESGSVDNRLGYGLTLATTWRGLDWREKSKVALYLPELTVNPSDAIKAVGLGAGLSFYFIKLAGGKMWTKHNVLSQGQAVGSVLGAAEELSTRETYGVGKWYVSLSLVGIPPFVP